MLPRIALIALHGIVAVSAIGGAIWVVPTMPLDWIRAGPFDDWTVPALALALVGTLAAVALAAVVMRPWLGALLSVVAGVAMIVFELVEVTVVGWTPADPRLNDSFQAYLQPIFLIVGGLQLALGLFLWLERRDEAPRLPIVHDAPAP